MILLLAWRNLWRRGRRTMFNIAMLAAIAALLVVLPSMQGGQYASMVRNQTSLLDGYAQIQSPDYLDRPGMREAFDPSEPAAALARLSPEVSATQRAVTHALVSSGSRTAGVQLMGVDPATEPHISTIPGKLVAGGYLQAADRIVLGELLADKLRVGVDDSVTILGIGLDGSLAADVLKVGGVLRTGIRELDRSLAQIPLARFDKAFAMEGRRHAIVLGGGEVRSMDSAVAGLKEEIEGIGLAVRDWRELQPGMLHAIELDIATAAFFYGIVVVVVVFSLLNNLMMSVLERTREFGMVLALGVRQSMLAVLVWTETFLLALAGLGGGMALGAAAALWWGERGIVFESAEEIFREFGMTATVYPELTWLTLVLGPGVVFLALAAVSVLPLMRILGMRPLESMHAT